MLLNKVKVQIRGYVEVEQVEKYAFNTNEKCSFKLP